MLIQYPLHKENKPIPFIDVSTNPLKPEKNVEISIKMENEKC
jgi:hypothetical protein